MMMDRVMNCPPLAGMQRPARPRTGNVLVKFFYWLNPAWFAPRKVCAWCKTVIAAGGFFSQGKTSHGVCPRCSEEALEQSRIARRLALEERAGS